MRTTSPQYNLANERYSNVYHAYSGSSHPGFYHIRYHITSAEIFKSPTKK